MKLCLRNIGKRFHQKWVFRDLNLDFEKENHYAVTGKNGSGKSTLLMICAGYLSPTRGSIDWHLNDNKLSAEDVYRNVSMASPYLELIEEFTLNESIRFHQKFKPYLGGFQPESLIELSGLGDSMKKPLRNFSSGMKQRVKLLLAIMSDTQLVLLDEPGTNLDSEAMNWYHELKATYGACRTFIICSNHNPREYPGVSHVYSIP